jgi:3-hydroxymyristoyl/3-hydroxydecanoyl-(acyl carrier protein) dehydratase
MPDLTLDHAALHRWLPHRGVNLFIDEVWTNAERNRSRSRTRILAPEHRERELLLRSDEQGRACWSEPFLIELMALSGITQLHEGLEQRGLISVFSAISRIQFHGLAPAGAEILGEAEIIRQRGDFSIFATRATCDGRPLLEAEVMSGAQSMADIAKVGSRPFTSAPAGEALDPAWLAWKPPHLRFVDRIVAADAGRGTLTCSYVYPERHPFVAGHFPEAPLMMGVTQWSALADAAWIARQKFGLTGAIVAQGTIKRQGGGEILDVRDLVIEGLVGADGRQVPRIAATKRLAFREVVRPGDGMLIEVAVSPAPAPSAGGQRVGA